MDNKRNLLNLVLLGQLSAVDTIVRFDSDYTSILPEPPFYMTISPPGQLSTPLNSEIVLVTQTDYGFVIVERGKKGTDAKQFENGAIMSSGIYAETAPAIGDIVMTLNAAPASGRLFMNGGTHNKADYPLLYDHVSRNSAYGVVTTTTFTLADMRTRMPVGSGASYILGSTGGEEKHTLTGDELPNSKFFLGFHGDGDSTVLSRVSSSGAVKNIPKQYDRYRPGGSGTAGAQSIGNVSFEFGADQAHNNMPPYIVVNYEVVAG